MEKRKIQTIEERVAPCECCGFPLTHRHHIYSFPIHGENLHSWQLCATCHELLHIAIGAIIYKRKRSSEVWNAVAKKLGNNNIIKFMLDRVETTAEMHFELSIDSTEVY
jgi:hypothetical protein